MTIEEIRSGIDTRGTGECSKLTSVFCDRKTDLTATRSNKKNCDGYIFILYSKRWWYFVSSSVVQTCTNK
jgi:hypothetical protein